MRKSTSFFASFFFSIVFLFASRLLAQVDWTHISDQPVLSYGESGSWDKFLVGFPAIIKDGDTLKMWYTGGTQGYKVSNLRIGYAWSTDGTNWHRYERNPIISASLNWEGSQLEPGIVIKDGNLYKMWYSAGTLTKTNIGYAYSENGINWTKHSEAVLTCGPAGDWESEDGFGFHFLTALAICTSVFLFGAGLVYYVVSFVAVNILLGLSAYMIASAVLLEFGLDYTGLIVNAYQYCINTLMGNS